MVYYSLGQALKDQLDLQGAAETFSAIARFNPRSAQAYWALGKVQTSTSHLCPGHSCRACPLAQVHAATRDEFDSDPEDPNDPSHFYEIAVSFNPTRLP